MIEDFIVTYKQYWELIIFLYILVIAIVQFIALRIIKSFMERAEQTQIIWDDLLLKSLKTPVSWGVWIFGITHAARLIALVTDVNWNATVMTIQESTLIIIIILVLMRFVGQIKSRLSNGHYMKKPMDQTTAQIVCKLLQFSISITGALVILQTLGYSVSGVLAFGGVGGIAIGFAARDLLANFFGALMVYLDKPFKIGEWIRSPDKEVEGVVEEIGWRSTKIRTFDKRILFVPNSVFNQISLENPSRMSNRRIYETIGIRYSDIDKMSTIVEQVQSYLKNNEAIDTRQTLIVNFDKFNNSSIDFFIYTFTKTTDWVLFHQIKHQVLLDIAGIISSNGAEIAFPTRTVLLEQG